MSDKQLDYGDKPPPDYDGSSSKPTSPPGTLDYELEPYKKCLPKCDLYIGIDKSASMGADCEGNDPTVTEKLSRWAQLGRAVKELAPYATEADADGIEVFFVTLEAQAATNCRTTNDVETELLRMRPSGKTPLGSTLWNQLEPYLKDLREHIPKKKRMEETLLGKLFTSHFKSARIRLKIHSELTKPRNYIIITDGEADDTKLLRYTILHAAQTLQDLDCVNFTCSACKKTHRQLGIQFVQIGNDQAAAAFLEELDNIQGRSKSNTALPDIVDTTPAAADGTFSAERLAKAILGGFTSDFDGRDEGEWTQPQRNDAVESVGHTCPLVTSGSGPGCWYLDEKINAWKRDPKCGVNSSSGMAKILSPLKM